MAVTFFLFLSVFTILIIQRIFISDYYYSANELKKRFSPDCFTLTPCGSVKTLEFMQWLGIGIPKWMENDLNHSKDTLGKSIELCKINCIRTDNLLQREKMFQ